LNDHQQAVKLPEIKKERARGNTGIPSLLRRITIASPILKPVTNHGRFSQHVTGMLRMWSDRKEDRKRTDPSLLMRIYDRDVHVSCIKRWDTFLNRDTGNEDQPFFRLEQSHRGWMGVAPPDEREDPRRPKEVPLVFEPCGASHIKGKHQDFGRGLHRCNV